MYLEQKGSYTMLSLWKIVSGCKKIYICLPTCVNSNTVKIEQKQYFLGQRWMETVGRVGNDTEREGVSVQGDTSLNIAFCIILIFNIL